MSYLPRVATAALAAAVLPSLAHSQATGNFPSFQAALENWPARWNQSDCRDRISVPASCAELTDGFVYDANGGYLYAPNHRDGVHGGCSPDGAVQHGPNRDCGQAVFRFHCHAPATVQFAGYLQSSTDQFRGNDDSFWTWQDDNENFAQFTGARSSTTWRLGYITAGHQFSAGTHTLVFSEREDGTRLRNVAIMSGFPTCHFGVPGEARTAVESLASELEAVESVLTSVDNELSTQASSLAVENSAQASTISQLTADRDSQSTLISTLESRLTHNEAEMSSTSTLISNLNSAIIGISATASRAPRYSIQRNGQSASQPLVEASGRNVAIKAPGQVTVTGQCGSVDLCELGQQVEAISSVLSDMA